MGLEVGRKATPGWRTLALTIALAGAYMLAAWPGFAFSAVPGRVSLVWPAAGVALAGLLLLGLRFWPGVAAGAFLFSVLFGAPVPAALFTTVGATTAAVVGTLALNRLHLRRGLDAVVDVVAFIVIGALFAPVLSASIGTMGLVAAGRIVPGDTFATAWKWWLGDATGVLVVGAAVLAIGGNRRWSFSRARVIEGIGLIAAILLVGLIVLGLEAGGFWSNYPLAYLFFPIIIRAAFRYGPPGASVAALLVAAMAVPATANGYGPFVGSDATQSLSLHSLFLGVVSGTGLFVAAVVAERGRAAFERQRLASIIQATSDFVGIMHVDGRTMFLNRAGRAMLGIAEKEDVSATAFVDLHAAGSAQRIREVGLPHALATGLWSGEGKLRHRDGTEIPVSQVIVAHRDAQGAVRFLSTVARDLTERIGLETQLIRAQRLEAVGQLAGGIAHDFNNLLTIILGQSRLTLDALDDEHPARAGLDEVLEAADRAAGLTRQLLAFARRQRVEPRVVDLNVLVLRMERMLRRLIGADITLLTRCDESLYPVRIDPGQFEQLLANLVVNARDAMPDGGRLTIETMNIELTADQIHPDWPLSPGACVRVSVTDTGIGMDEATLAHIFEPFFTTKGIEKGTGLGLATCYGIAAQAGGAITVESRPGAGARFLVLLPPASEPVDEVDAVRADGGGFVGHGIVLVVEDEPAVRYLVQRILEDHGYEVLLAADGAAALDLAERRGHRLDLVITDMVMPEMSGPQLIDRLRSAGCTAKVLFMSGYSTEPLPAAGTAFLAKPFSPAQLARQVQTLLSP